MSSDPDQERAALTQSPTPLPASLPADQSLRPGLEQARRPTNVTLAEKTSSTLKKQWAKYILLSVAITLLAIAISLATAYKLLVNDVDYKIPVAQGQAVIHLSVNLLAVDPIAGTMTLDWYPLPIAECELNPPEGVYDIYFDPNLIIEDGDPPDDAPPPSNEPASEPTFTFNTTRYCKQTLKDSIATFRTTNKLSSDNNARGSLQAYPFDLYKTQISLFVLDNSNNGSVRAEISKTWGVAVNFNVEIGDEQYNSVEGMYYQLNVSRSTAVKVFVMFIVIANWIVTLVFLWITIACLFWQERVVRELFVVPVSVLFAFTAVRSSMPGSPAGFGAFIDFVGILPNLALLTFCSFILLLVVLYQRIVDTYQDMEQAKQGLPQMPEGTPRDEKQMV